MDEPSSFPRHLHSRIHRWIRIGEWLLFALLVAHFCVRTVPTAWQRQQTDFPDYFLPAVLVHQHYDTSRVYEWLWLQRQKDHHDIGVQMINLAPSTAFSTLALYPLTSMSAMAAKRCWIVFNFGLLVATLFVLRRMTCLPWRTIALVAALSLPLLGNFVFGQFYVLLLFLLTLACSLYLRQQRFMAGMLVGVAAGLKVFPVIYFLYFLRKHDLKAFAGGVAGGAGAAIVSLLAFGLETNRTYLSQVLPWTLRGEAMTTYLLGIPSLASLLHRLFVYEPQLNPHPALHAAWLFAVLHPLLQMAVMAPALLLAVPHNRSAQPESLRRLRLEWAAILVASLAISTSPQSYQFTLLILPACIAMEALEAERSYLPIAFLFLLFTAIGIVNGTDHVPEGWGALLGVPRLYLLLLASVAMYALQIRRQSSARRHAPQQPAAGAKPTAGAKRDRLLWAAALSAMLVMSVWGNLRHLRGLYDDYRFRIPVPNQAYMVVHPAVQGDAVEFVAMMADGYHSGVVEEGMKGGGTTEFNSTRPDQLAISAGNAESWVEQSEHESTIVSTLGGTSAIPNSESPVASFDGRWLAFLREDKGSARVWVHALESPAIADRPVTPQEMNALEMSFLPNGDLIFAAISGERTGLYFASGVQSPNQFGSLQSLGAEEARYPAVSPDGHWLAYSRLQNGNWNLWLRDLTNGQSQRLTQAECNATEPAWDSDSHTLVYASDCGRALWFSALCRRRVVP